MNQEGNKSSILTVGDHRRDVAGLRYVYPVISRRAGGVSIGINLNTNNACNWRCVYCQVPGLQRGDAPPVDMKLLRDELSGFLHELLHGTFMADRVPEGSRRIVDVALSGNGEPTSAEEFPEVLAAIVEVVHAHGLLDRIAIRLITNGSRVMRTAVQQGLMRMAASNGEVWFKVDAGSPELMQRINGASMPAASVARNLRECASLCPTWVQTCAFGWNDALPLRDDMNAYLDLLRAAGVESLRGVHLYSLARPSLQPEAPELRQLTIEELEQLATPIRSIGLAVQVNR